MAVNLSKPLFDASSMKETIRDHRIIKVPAHQL